MSAHQRLKHETLAEHQRVELLSPGEKIMAGSITRNEYKDFLLANFYFHHEIEKQLDKFFLANPMHDLDFDSRKKSPAIIADLEILGQKEIPDVEIFSSEFISIPEALGSMYVSEGSMLGGAVIARQLQKISKENFPVNFYTCYGDDLGSKWKNFVSILDKKIPPSEENTAVDAAKRAFSFFEQCLHWQNFVVKRENLAAE